MKTITAIDIGTSAVKLVQMERSKGKIQIVNIGVETYPRQNGSGVDDDTVISCLKGLLAKLALKPKSAIVSIPRAFLTLKRLSNFPRAATDEDIAKLVPFQVEQELPLGLENSIYDYYGLRRSESGASVDLVAARRDFIEGYLKTLKAVGMKVDALYPSTFAIYNLLLQQLEENEENGDKIIGVIDIGACRSELLIMRGKNMVFSTSFKWGGDDLSRLYQNRKTAAEPAQDLSLHLAELDPQFFSWLERLSSEISRAFYAFSSQNLIGNDRRSVDQLWLCGGCTQLKGLDRYLSQLLKVETNIWNPLNLNLFECKSDLKESIELGGIGGNIGISLGLGVASLIGNNDVKVNLIPIEIKQRAVELKRKASTATMAILLGLLIILGTWWLRDLIRAKEAEVSVLNLEVKSAQTKLQRIRGILVKDLIMQDMVVKQLSPLDVLKELSERFPDRKKVALTSLSLDKNGKVIVNLEASSNSDISEAIQAINASPIFEKVESGAISKAEKDKKQILQIQLSFRLKNTIKSIQSSMTAETKQTSTSEKSQTITGDSDEKLLREQLEQKKKEMLGVK